MLLPSPCVLAESTLKRLFFGRNRRNAAIHMVFEQVNTGENVDFMEIAEIFDLIGDFPADRAEICLAEA